MSTRIEPQAEQVTDRTRALPALDTERRRVMPPSWAAEAASALEAAAHRRRQIELALGRQLRQQAQARAQRAAEAGSGPASVSPAGRT